MVYAILQSGKADVFIACERDGSVCCWRAAAAGAAAGCPRHPPTIPRPLPPSHADVVQQVFVIMSPNIIQATLYWAGGASGPC